MAQSLKYVLLPYISVVQATEGNYEIQLGDGPTYNTDNKGFFIAPSDVQQRIIHNTDKNSGKIRCRWVFLKVRINELYSFDDLYSFPVILPEPYKSKMNTIFDRLFSSDSVFDEYACYYEIVSLLSSVAVKKEQVNSTVLYEILSSKTSKNIVEISTEVGICDSVYFNKIFKKHYQVSPTEYRRIHK